MNKQIHNERENILNDHQDKNENIELTSLDDRDDISINIQEGKKNSSLTYHRNKANISTIDIKQGKENTAMTHKDTDVNISNDKSLVAEESIYEVQDACCSPLADTEKIEQSNDTSLTNKKDNDISTEKYVSFHEKDISFMKNILSGH